jgi:hypothetical protein
VQDQTPSNAEATAGAVSFKEASKGCKSSSQEVETSRKLWNFEDFEVTSSHIMLISD